MREGGPSLTCTLTHLALTENNRAAPLASLWCAKKKSPSDPHRNRSSNPTTPLFPFDCKLLLLLLPSVRPVRSSSIGGVRVERGEKGGLGLPLPFPPLHREGEGENHIFTLCGHPNPLSPLPPSPSPHWKMPFSSFSAAGKRRRSEDRENLLYMGRARLRGTGEGRRGEIMGSASQ